MLLWCIPVWHATCYHPSTITLFIYNYLKQLVNTKNFWTSSEVFCTILYTKYYIRALISFLLFRSLKHFALQNVRAIPPKAGCSLNLDSCMPFGMRGSETNTPFCTLAGCQRSPHQSSTRRRKTTMSEIDPRAGSPTRALLWLRSCHRAYLRPSILFTSEQNELVSLKSFACFASYKFVRV